MPLARAETSPPSQCFLGPGAQQIWWRGPGSGSLSIVLPHLVPRAPRGLCPVPAKALRKAVPPATSSPPASVTDRVQVILLQHLSLPLHMDSTGRTDSTLSSFCGHDTKMPHFVYQENMRAVSTSVRAPGGTSRGTHAFVPSPSLERGPDLVTGY